MTDKELLVLAAKAAGAYDICSDSERVTVRWSPILRGHIEWNPLTDDGDALRLAVDLKLTVHQNHSGVEVRWISEHLWENHDSDEYAATRRAIVRAAAAIGAKRNDNTN